jgi:pilus assembly protein CpaB
MARAKGWIWISLALVCALGAAALTYFILQQQNQAVEIAVQEARTEVQSEQRPTVLIPVAGQDLERGTVLNSEFFDEREFFADAVPSSAITDTTLLEGQVLAANIAAGDIFRPETIYGGTGAPLSAEIEEGRTVVAFPIVDLLTGLAVFVEGDKVDMLITLPVPAEGDGTQQDGTQQGGNLTGYTIQNVRIMRIVAPQPTSDNPNPAPTALLLELDPADAVMVKKVKDAGGTIDMALRSPLDDDNFTVPPVTDEQLFDLITNGEPPATVGNAP